TNHLDIQSINILIQALKQYQGTFIIVSHDRYVLDEVANKIWYIEDGKIKEYPGTFREFEDWNEKRARSRPAPTAKKEKKSQTKKKPEKQDDTRQREYKRLNREVADYENRIIALESELKETESRLGKPEIYQDPDTLSSVQQDYARLKESL